MRSVNYGGEDEYENSIIPALSLVENRIPLRRSFIIVMGFRSLNVLQTCLDDLEKRAKCVRSNFRTSSRKSGAVRERGNSGISRYAMGQRCTILVSGNQGRVRIVGRKVAADSFVGTRVTSDAMMRQLIGVEFGSLPCA